MQHIDRQEDLQQMGGLLCLTHLSLLLSQQTRSPVYLEIPYISNDNFSQEGIFDYWNGKLAGLVHVKRTYPDVVRLWRQFHSSMVALDLEEG